MATLFSRIIKGEIPSYKVAENATCFSFLDIKPLTKGHTLVIPKLEVDYIFDLPDEVLQEMICFSKRVAVAIKKVIPCARIGVSVIGLEVPHAHIHLVPINSISDLNFSNPRLNFSKEEYETIASQIHGTLETSR